MILRNCKLTCFWSLCCFSGCKLTQHLLLDIFILSSFLSIEKFRCNDVGPQLFLLPHFLPHSCSAPPSIPGSFSLLLPLNPICLPNCHICSSPHSAAFLTPWSVSSSFPVPYSWESSWGKLQVHMVLCVVSQHRKSMTQRHGVRTLVKGNEGRDIEDGPGENYPVSMGL